MLQLMERCTFVLQQQCRHRRCTEIVARPTYLPEEFEVTRLCANLRFTRHDEERLNALS
jgi:hypothetical protein